MQHPLRILLTPMLTLPLTLLATGCEKDGSRRLAEMAERHLERQAEQTRQVTELQRQVAEGSRRLVAADAEAREAIIALQRDVQAERSEVGRQRDQLEAERRELAGKRQRDPVIAAAVLNVGTLLGCLLPLIVCWLLLARRAEPASDEEVAELLLNDLVTDKPLLLPRGSSVRALGWHDDQTEAANRPD